MCLTWTWRRHELLDKPNAWWLTFTNGLYHVITLAETLVTRYVRDRRESIMNLHYALVEQVVYSEMGEMNVSNGASWSSR